MIYKLVPFHEIAEYVAKKVPEHYRDVLEREGSHKPNVDWEYYLSASYSGQCIAVAAIDKEIVGYSVFFIETNANHKHILEAMNAGVFIEKSYRGRIAIEFLKQTDDLIKSTGVHTINYLLKDRRIGRLLARNGYRAEMTLWSKS